MNRLKLCIALAGGIGLVSCSSPKQVTASAASPAHTPVAVARVARQDLARTLELAAEFRPHQDIDVHAKVSGYLKSIYVDVGDRVRQGQVIAELEVPEMIEEIAQASVGIKRTELDVQRAAGELQRAEAAVQIHELSYKRIKAVSDAQPNLIAQQEVDNSLAKLREAEAQLITAKAALAVTEEQVRFAQGGKTRMDTMMRYLRITAPFDGVITRRLGDPGALIQAGTASHTQAMPVVRLSQMDRLRLVLPVPESIAYRIRIGAPVEVRVESMNRVIQGHVSRFAGKLDTSTRTMETEVDIPNANHAILPGMYGYASLRLDHREDALAVPVQAVARSGATATVMLVNERKQLEERRIDLGLETPDAIEVLSGLKEHDLVVIGNRSQLKAGVTVEPKLMETVAATQAH